MYNFTLFYAPAPKTLADGILLFTNKKLPFKRQTGVDKSFSVLLLKLLR